MKFIMTLYAYRNNIEPMLFFVALPVMILMRLFRAIMAQFSIRAWQFFGSNSVVHGVPGFNYIWVLCFITLLCFFSFFCFSIFISCFVKNNFTFGCFSVFLTSSAMNNFAFRCFLKIVLNSFTTSFAICLKSIIYASIFIKISNWFDLLAMRTSFCFNWFSHYVLSLSKNVLVRADRTPIALFGSSYYIADWGSFK